MNQKPNYYQILQVDSSAEPEVIEGAYKRLAKKYHPDMRDAQAVDQQRMQLINEAYQVLSDPKWRAQYDRELRLQAPLAHNDFGDELYTPTISSGKNTAKPLPPRINQQQPLFVTQLAKIVLYTASGVLILVLLGIIVWLVRDRFFSAPQEQVTTTNGTNTAELETAMKEEPVTVEAQPTMDSAVLASIKMMPIDLITSEFSGGHGKGISRLALLHTTIPTRPRTNVITYKVVKGDNLFTIGEKFGIKPETVLWGNYEVLNDNPRMLSIGQELNILPIDGTYHQWKEGDTLRKVAETYKVDPQVILEYPGNRFDLTKSTIDDPKIEVGTWLIVPGGKRPIKDWGPPAITRDNPAVAAYYGEGACGKVYSGAVGTGTFVWPVPSNHSVSGYDYTEIHKAIDIGGQIGAPVVAADSGVVVFSGWSQFGYGNLLVIDHGNGWQTAYAHLNAVGATCGQSVYQGGTVATLGNTGNSSGPHLHFEMKYNGANVNPHDFIQ